MTSSTLINLADGITAATSTFRARRSDESILPAEDWCPFYVFYAGTTQPKFTDGQIETIATQGIDSGWCNLCDGKMPSDREAHVREHMTQLRTWKRTRGKAIEDKRKARGRALGKARAEA